MNSYLNAKRFFIALLNVHFRFWGHERLTDRSISKRYPKSDVAQWDEKSSTQFSISNSWHMILLVIWKSLAWAFYCWVHGVESEWKRLEVNKCAFTFSSEIRQIQCTRTEFWCIQCPRPAGPSALDKHQIQASTLDLSYFTSKSKCKFINLIHTRQKNKIICSRSWKIINKMV